MRWMSALKRAASRWGPLRATATRARSARLARQSQEGRMDTRRNRLWILISTMAVAGAIAAPLHPVAAASTSFIYWDENERQLVYTDPGGSPSDLVPYYDPNGQMCIWPDKSGRFTTGYNPTLPSQNNPGSLKPLMNPPVGEAVWDKHGGFTGRTIYVPGPYRGTWEAATDPGGDIPPDNSSNPPTFNNNGTMTGCVFDTHGNLFAVDLGNSQGTFPPQDSGRLIEWYAA